MLEGMLPLQLTLSVLFSNCPSHLYVVSVSTSGSTTAAADSAPATTAAADSAGAATAEAVAPAGSAAALVAPVAAAAGLVTVFTTLSTSFAARSVLEGSTAAPTQ